MVDEQEILTPKVFKLRLLKFASSQDGDLVCMGTVSMYKIERGSYCI